MRTHVCGCSLLLSAMLLLSLRPSPSCALLRGMRGGLRTGTLQAARNYRFAHSSRSTMGTRHIRAKEGEGDESKYRGTVLLPQTSFDQRANAVVREPEIQKWWEENQIYEKLAVNNPGDLFVLHDGPPYANGDLHMGHALNKILKDFINRYQMLKGRKVRYVPGWDCHGLPIELKVVQSLKTDEREGMTPIQLRKKAATFAIETVDKQRSAFKRFGVWGDWDKPYMTLQKEYEAQQISVFGKMVLNGHIYRGFKPVHWSPSSRTALAEAELEYPENHISRSIYVGFNVVELSDPLKEAGITSENLQVAIWTTTPWTIPANLAVAVNENIDYSIVSNAATGVRYIVAKDLVPAFSEKVLMKKTEQLQILATFKGAQIVGIKYQHPLFERTSEVVVGGDYITTESGTGLVHTAPGHGQDDYLTGLKYNLPLLSPVDDAGRFTDEAGEKFKGLAVLKEGNEAVIVALNESGALLREEAYNHKYPYDWRTKKPTIFRATDQWFASVQNFRDSAMTAIDTVQWVPSVGRNRIAAMVSARSDWCISRQRSWGVPIPVFYNKDTREPLLTQETLKHVEGVFRERGSDAWWELPIEDLLPEQFKPQADMLERGNDTMDVWFDSGSSWAGVCTESLKYPVDMYLEGSDQHRGWFQSSLLTSVATNGVAPYNTVLTHGFVLDEKGYKMSKSLGNVIDPKEIIEGGKNKKTDPAYGADVLRLWVSSVDYNADVSIGPSIVKQVADSYRKLRNTARYILGNLHDFDPSIHSVQIEDLPSLDRYILGRLSATVKEVTEAYDDFAFYKANQALTRFAVSDLSNFYLDLAKDRLYIAQHDDWRRRSCQTVLSYMIEHMASALSPLLPHMAEEIYGSIPYAKTHTSVFQKGWVATEFEMVDDQIWELIRLLRNDVNKCIDVARKEKTMGASMDASSYLYHPDSNIRDRLKKMSGDSTLLGTPQSTNGVDDLRFVLMTSQVHVVDSPEEVLAACPQYSLEKADQTESGAVVGVQNAKGHKCERCWYFCESVHSEADHPELCSRCAHVVRKANDKLAHVSD